MMNDKTTPLALNEYAQAAAKTAIYPGQGSVQGLLYTTLGLAGESGEIANQAKKILRDDQGQLADTRREKMIDELGDVLWYAANLAIELGISLESVATQNLEKLHARAETGTLTGDKRG